MCSTYDYGEILLAVQYCSIIALAPLLDEDSYSGRHNSPTKPATPNRNIQAS